MKRKQRKAEAFLLPLMMAISLIAASVGTGNIWRFPRVMATNGGSAFVVAYVVIMLIAVIPVMMGEHVIGRCTRKGLPGAFRDFLGSRKATWLGTFVEWVVIITIAYYTVVVHGSSSIWASPSPAPASWRTRRVCSPVSPIITGCPS